MNRVMDEAVVVHPGSIDIPYEVKDGNTFYLSNTRADYMSDIKLRAIKRARAIHLALRLPSLSAQWCGSNTAVTFQPFQILNGFHGNHSW